ncbi:MAG: amino acid ABC transporter ATP-binding protein [Vicinamibacterales bacterium]
MARLHAMTPVMEMRRLRLTRGTREVLRGVDLAVERGEILALMGLSGSGKTTILRAVAGLEAFHAGDVFVGGVQLTRGQTRPRATRAPQQHVGMVFQFHFLFEHLPALDNVSLAPIHVQRITRGEAESRAHVLLEELGVGHRAQALPRELSGGEAQRVAIARALAVDPPLLLLDEPTASLDPARRNELGETLRLLARQGRTLVMTSHDDDFVRDYATRVVILADGSIVEEGHPGQVLEHPQHPKTQELLQVEHQRKLAGRR